MATVDEGPHDIMQVCRNGHVITDMLRTYPERGRSHCDRCGAATLDCCPTCGHELPGAGLVPGLVPVGRGRAPRYCSACGAPFPWAFQPASVIPDVLVTLTTLWRRLPRVIRELRTRHDNRPPFRVVDVHDLEDLVRALLPLHFDDIRPESRTPAYAPGTRTDFLLRLEDDTSIAAVVIKQVTPVIREQQLAEQWREDTAYYAHRQNCRFLVALIYDGEGRLSEPQQVEAIWSKPCETPSVACVIAS